MSEEKTCWYTCNTDMTNCMACCPRYHKMNFLLNNCGVNNPQKYMIQLTPQYGENTIPYEQLQEIKNNSFEYITKGNNLCIASYEHRTGKTTWSVKIMFKYFDSIWAETQLIPRGYLLPTSEFLLKIKSYTYRDSDEFNEIDNILKTADIVIWDNITNFILSAEQQIILDAYIGQRISNGKSNIFNGIESENLVNTVGYNLSSYINSSNHICLDGTSR